MSANIFGERLKFISYGESHGPAYGIVLEGFPANITINENLLQINLNKRKTPDRPACVCFQLFH